MRTKKAILNYITDVLPMIILMFIGLIKIDYFIEFLGQEKNGLYNLYSQIMAYVTIVDGGLTSAVIYRMYAPISSKNYSYLGSLLKGSKKIFNVVGGLVSVLGLGVSFFLQAFVKDNVYDPSYLQLTFLLYLVGSVVPYFCVVSKTLMEAYQEKYISNMIMQTISIIKGILEIVVLLRGGDLYSIIFLYTLSNVISSVIVSIVAKKRYDFIKIKDAKPSYEILSDVKNLMIHKLGTLVAYNVDTIIISTLKGLTYVTIYTSYNYIINNLTTILGKISYSMTAGVGDLMQEGKEKAHEFYCEFNSFSFFLGVIVCVPLMIVMNPFIDIWLNGKIDTTFLLALAFTLNTYYYIVRMPFRIYTTSAGMFKETRMLPIIETIVNLVLSLALIQKVGVAGVLIATFIAYMVSDYFIRPVILYKEFFHKSSKTYYMKNMFYIGLTIVNYVVMAFCFQTFVEKMDGYLNWFVGSVIIFTINFVITFLEFYFSGNMLFKDRIVRIVRKVFKKE